MPFSGLLLPFILTAVAAYMIGSISFSIIVTRIFAKTDVRKHGSGNAGTTNVLRTAGKIPAILTFLGDFLKCVAAIYFGQLLFNIFTDVHDVHIETTIKFIAGLFCLLGHVFPLFFGFRGGKGVVTTAALFMIISWQSALLAIGVFIIMVLITKIVSLSTITAAVALPIATCITMLISHNHYVLMNTVFAAVMSCILIVMHRKNIMRLIQGTEAKIVKKT